MSLKEKAAPGSAPSQTNLSLIPRQLRNVISLSLNTPPGRVISNLSLGDVVVAALALCTLSGLILHQAYDPRDGATTIAGWLLAQPHLVLVRNFHYWTAQLFVVSSAAFLWRFLGARASQPIARTLRPALVLGVPLIAFQMASGFLLRGDADAHVFQPLFASLVTELPFIGPFLAAHLFGTDEHLPTVLFHHAITATVCLALIFAASWRRPAPRYLSLAVVAGTALVVSLFLSPGLNDGLDRRATGPWLFLPAQEVLGWRPESLLVVTLGIAALWLWWALPRFSAAAAAQVRVWLLVASGSYGVLVGLGLFWPATNGDRSFHWPNGRGDWRLGSIVPPPPSAPGGSLRPPPVVRGRPEGCLICHGNLTGLGNSHRPETIGCASCHGGNTTTLDADRAHAAMIRVPGNLADAPHTCGTTGCHADIVPRVERSIMSTFAGVIDVNRRIFGESVDPAAPPPHVHDLKHSAADSHLRQLCVSCHLGQEKEAWGPIVQESRGGGCNACHLVYPPDAAQALARYEATPLPARKTIPQVHPSLTVNPENNHCFGCHSRSGRISTSYEGWHELRDNPSPAELKSDNPGSPRFRLLDDGRYFVRVTPDVHQTRGLECIDCHTSSEVMGNGRTVRRKSEQLQVRCEDCHARPLAAQPTASIDSESHKLLGLRQWQVTQGQRLGTTRDGGTLVNVIVNPDGTGHLRRKRTGQSADLRAPLAVCREGPGHDRLSCASCHTAWAPRCASCHTNFDPSAEGFDHLTQRETKGAWIERLGAFETAPPTLGIRLDPSDSARPRGVVDTFVPGMILEIDRNRTAGAPPDPIFRRLYAHMAPHTTTREARSCQSCHNDPVALGYGRGTLRYDATGTTGRWFFTPVHAPSPQDGLPADAWIGFLQTRTGMVSTRDDVRPFTIEEQHRILRVGACLTCHPGDSPVMRESVRDFGAILRRLGPQCVVPIWP